MPFCSVCKGTGADPMSDNLDWLPCSECGGSGRAQTAADAPHYDAMSEAERAGMVAAIGRAQVGLARELALVQAKTPAPAQDQTARAARLFARLAQRPAWERAAILDLLTQVLNFRPDDPAGNEEG